MPSANPLVSRTILRQLLTPGLYARLSKPDRFMKDARGTFWTPCLIWGDTQREELHKYLRAQVDLVQQSHLWDGSTAAHLLQYTAVSTEITICDVFLQLYNEQPVNNSTRGGFWFLTWCRNIPSRMTLVNS
jgi:hypothetical protein